MFMRGRSFEQTIYWNKPHEDVEQKRKRDDRPRFGQKRMGIDKCSRLAEAYGYQAYKFSVTLARTSWSSIVAKSGYITLERNGQLYCPDPTTTRGIQQTRPAELGWILS